MNLLAVSHPVGGKKVRGGGVEWEGSQSGAVLH